MSAFQILGGEDYVPFITDISVKNLGQIVTIECTGDPQKELDYRVICSGCEKVEINFHKERTNFIHADGSIEVVEFSTREESDNKRFVYLYARVVLLEFICESIKVEKDW
ncbi:MAG: hypothetical protein AAF298_11905 [Cyanobacteria bacterium P01_A01_bin.40]